MSTGPVGQALAHLRDASGAADPATLAAITDAARRRLQRRRRVRVGALAAAGVTALVSVVALASEPRESERPPEAGVSASPNPTSPLLRRSEPIGAEDLMAASEPRAEGEDLAAQPLLWCPPAETSTEPTAEATPAPEATPTGAPTAGATPRPDGVPTGELCEPRWSAGGHVLVVEPAETSIDLVFGRASRLSWAVRNVSDRPLAITPVTAWVVAESDDIDRAVTIQGITAARSAWLGQQRVVIRDGQSSTVRIDPGDVWDGRADLMPATAVTALIDDPEATLTLQVEVAASVAAGSGRVVVEVPLEADLAIDPLVAELFTSEELSDLRASAVAPPGAVTVPVRDEERAAVGHSKQEG